MIVDSPSVGSHYGTAVSAPVFRELAQEVLEYLGVPHDQPLRPEKLMAQQKIPRGDDSADNEHPEDLNSLFAQVNDLPADDPLRQPAPTSTSENAATSTEDSGTDQNDGVTGSGDASDIEKSATLPSTPHKATTPATATHDSALTVTAGASVTVPNFSGDSMRKAVETATRLGLGVQVLGSGVEHEQAPVAGTHVPPGTEVILRFSH